MAWSGGTYTKGNSATGGWVGDASLGIGIEAGRHDTQDNDFATGINQCLNKDGSNPATGNLNIGNYRITNVAAGTSRSDAGQLGQIQDGSVLYGGTSGGAANAQTLTLSPPITAYVAGQRFSFLAGFTNTAAATLNINGSGAKNIFNAATGAAIGAREIVSGRAYEVLYDGTQFLLLNDITAIQNGDYIWLGTTGGSATAQTASATPAITAYKTGQKFRMLPGFDSSGQVPTAHTLNINSLGAKTIVMSNGGSPTIGCWFTGAEKFLEVIYVDPYFVVTSSSQYYSTWTSSLTPSAGTASSVNFVNCKYIRLGNSVSIQVNVGWTQSGASAAYIDLSLPIRPAVTSQNFPCSITTGAVLVAGWGIVSSLVGSGTVRCYDYAQGAILTGSKALVVSGTYELG